MDLNLVILFPWQWMLITSTVIPVTTHSFLLWNVSLSLSTHVCSHFPFIITCKVKVSSRAWLIVWISFILDIWSCKISLRHWNRKWNRSRLVAVECCYECYGEMWLILQNYISTTYLWCLSYFSHLLITSL